MTVLLSCRGQFFMAFKEESHNCAFCLQSWDIFFRNTNAGAPPGTAYQSPLSLSRSSLATMAHAQSLVEAQPNVDKLVEDHLAVQSLIRAYQVSGCHQFHTRYRIPQDFLDVHCLNLFQMPAVSLLLWAYKGKQQVYKRKEARVPQLSNFPLRQSVSQQLMMSVHKQASQCVGMEG